MEQHLFITAIIAFVFDRISKYFVKKNYFDNIKFLKIWNVSFAFIAGCLVYYILNFMASNGAAQGFYLHPGHPREGLHRRRHPTRRRTRKIRPFRRTALQRERLERP